MKLNKIYLLLALLFALTSTAQEGLPIYSDYFASNYYLLHPSMAGAASYNQVRLTARQQWFDQNDSPNLQTASVNARVSDKSGLGAIFYNDKNGRFSQTGGYLTYAHHLLLSRSEVDLNQLSFGLSAGLIQSRFDPTDISNFGDAGDPLLNSDNAFLRNGSFFNIDTGVSYNFLNFSGHFTIKNLLFVDGPTVQEPEATNNNQRRYLISAAYAITSGNYWAFEPSFLFQWQEATGQSAVDINFKAYRTFDFGKVWGGISHRRALDGAEFVDGNGISTQNLQYWTPVLGVNYNDFMFAYTYSALAGPINFTGGGFHQITVGYDFLGGRKAPYNCNCPAIN